jgi:hypothetical protein
VPLGIVSSTGDSVFLCSRQHWLTHYPPAQFGVHHPHHLSHKPTDVDPTANDFSGVPYKVGQSYLIGAVDGIISGCGVSGTDSAELRAIYDAAFPGGTGD